MTKLYINDHVLAQYELDEADPEFYFRLLAWLCKNELTFWNWSDHQIKSDIRAVALDVGPQVFAMSPTLGAALHQLLRRWSARGFVLGMRRLSSEAGLPMNFDFILPKKKRPETEVPWGELREVDPKDFEE